MRMPKSREEFEWRMLWAFSCGMNTGYGIEHTNISDEEDREIKEFAEKYVFKLKSIKIE